MATYFLTKTKVSIALPALCLSCNFVLDLIKDAYLYLKEWSYILKETYRIGCFHRQILPRIQFIILFRNIHEMNIFANNDEALKLYEMLWI